MESVDYFEELQNTYIWIDLDKDSSEELLRILANIRKLVTANLRNPKEFHLTIDYLWDISREALEEVMLITELCIFVNVDRITKQIEYTLWEPKHFRSHKTWEDIFYLPVSINDLMLWSFKHIWYSINEPHVTLLKWKDLKEEEIEKILRALKLAFIWRRYSLLVRNLCANWTRENWDKFKQYSRLSGEK